MFVSETKALMRCCISTGVDTENIQFIPMAYIQDGMIGMGKSGMGKTGTDILNVIRNVISSQFYHLKNILCSVLNKICCILCTFTPARLFSQGLKVNA